MKILGVLVAFALIVFFPGVGDVAGIAILLFIFTGKKS